MYEDMSFIFCTAPYARTKAVHFPVLLQSATKGALSIDRAGLHRESGLSSRLESGLALSVGAACHAAHVVKTLTMNCARLSPVSWRRRRSRKRSRGGE